MQKTNNPPTKGEKAFLLAAGHFLAFFPQDMSAQELSDALLASEDEPEHLENQKRIIPWEGIVKDMHPMDDPHMFLHELITNLAEDFVRFAEEWNS